MCSLLIYNAEIITPTKILPDAFVSIDRGKINRIGRQKSDLPHDADTMIDASGKLVVPGFIDLQVNGGVGEEFSQSPVEQFEKIIRFFCCHGTTSMLPTILTQSRERMLQSIERVAAFRRSDSECAHVVAGIHVEGPFLRPKRRGAHPARHLRKPDLGEVQSWLKAAPDDIRIVTLAPELEGSEEVIEFLSREGVIVSASHSYADYECMRESVQKGLSFVTHAGNTTDWPYRKRREGGRLTAEPGVVGSFLSMEKLSGSVIMDGFHFHPAMLKPILQCKGPERVALVTDAAFVAGLPPGTYHKGRETVAVTAAGYTKGRNKGWLAGSILTMDQAIKNAVSMAGLSVRDAIMMATLTPARILRMEKKKGRIAGGYDADLVILDRQLNVDQVILGGRVLVRQKPARPSRRKAKSTARMEE
jgi:N-acetylglucosamine-6-phosphate deacetylase